MAGKAEAGTPAAGASPLLIRTLGAGIREICLNRPERANALAPDMVEALTDAIAGAYADDTRMLVLRGAGRHFCGGFDRSGERALTAGERIGSAVNIETILQLLWRAPFVTVSLVQGAAIGAGCDLAVSCDYRVAGPASSFAFPGFRLMGVTLGTRRLAELIGGAAAFDLVLSGRRVDRETAFALGLVTHLEEPEAFDGFVTTTTTALEGVAKPSIAMLREAVRGGGSGAADLERVARSIAWAASEPPAPASG